MTTIAFKDGIIAGDSGIFEGSTLIGIRPKILRNNTLGIVGGAAGMVVDCQRFERWFQSNPKKKPPEFIDPDESAGFIVWPNSRIEYICSEGRTNLTGTKLYAIGTGAQLALGAMHAGASAEQAVRIAAQLDTYTREPVLTLRLKLK